MSGNTRFRSMTEFFKTARRLRMPMLGVGRSVSLLVAFYLPAFVATVYAECA